MDMEIVKLTYKPARDMGFEGTFETVVKRGKRIEAKIYSPNKFHSGEFKISMNTLAFYRPTYALALEFVRESVEGRFNAFGNGNNFNVTLESK